MNYNCDLVFTKTKDKLELPGLLFSPKNNRKKVGIVYLHGLHSNFYKNRIKKFANHFTKEGISLVSFAMRGTNAVNSFKVIDKRTKKGYTRKFIGAAFEIFEDSVYDIDAMITFLEKRGYKKIFLVGHSTGSNKAAYYAIKKKDKRVDGVVLLAPVADRPGLKKGMGKKFGKAVKVAKEMVKKSSTGRSASGRKKGDKLMPFELINDYMSAERFLSLAIPNTPEDVFTYRDGKDRLSHFNKITQPLMVLYGEKDEYLTSYKAKDLVKLFEEKSSGVPLFRGVVLKNTNHGFSRKENLVSKKILEFIDSV